MNKFNGGTTTYEVEGATRVRIAQNSDSDEKRFCTIQMTVRCVKKGGKQPRITIIFRGLGQRVSEEERGAWDPRVHVTWQKKAWADRDWCNKWVSEEFKRITGEFSDGRRSLAIMDNLDGQCPTGCWVRVTITE